MDTEYIRTHLPEQPPKGLLPWAKRELVEDLGGEYSVMEGIRVHLQPMMEELMDNQTVGKSVWAERVYCNACGEEYIAQKVPHMDAFYTCIWEDGTENYVLPETDVAMEEMPQVNQHGDELVCPLCGTKTTLVHANRIRGGRRKQIQVSTLHRVGEYAVICYWLVIHTVEEWGGSYYEVQPRYAYAIGKRGGVTAYSHRAPGFFGNDKPADQWHQLQSAHDRWGARYSDWGSINNTKSGTVPYQKELPDLTGTTGEKTGLAAYWQTVGWRPIDYIRLWRAWKPVEVIVNTGFANLVAQCIERDGFGLSPLAGICDISKRKPHEILRISKADLKAVKKRKTCPNWEQMEIWTRYLQVGGKMSLPALLDETDGQNFGIVGIRHVVDMMMEYRDCDVPKIRRYLVKQEMQLREIGILLDARRLQQQITGRTELTQEELWPRHLIDTHDRLDQLHTDMITAESAAKYQAGFDKVREKYSGICWHDNDLAIILPKCNADLIREGKVLRHCVGGYGKSHAKGHAIILFVRHYKKPTRPYYTLNMSFEDDKFEQIQLHGYGNERHGSTKQYSHKIPKKVLDFVERWKSEVVKPWWDQQQKQKEREKTA